MRLDEIYEVAKENFKFDLCELIDEYDEDDNRITILNESNGILIAVEFAEADEIRTMNRLLTYSEFMRLSWMDLEDIVNEMHDYAA